ncbi:hypothetical protein MRB53_003181 [Persea americana]|uniref:Uncharacterized protein n=1 Tax=Persea americana TaxID=3435 RepID=A0ACC2MXJ3_PERAE|nr:hypothetical protein MRB53_003181 [Persea americana]
MLDLDARRHAEEQIKRMSKDPHPLATSAPPRPQTSGSSPLSSSARRSPATGPTTPTPTHVNLSPPPSVNLSNPPLMDNITVEHRGCPERGQAPHLGIEEDDHKRTCSLTLNGPRFSENSPLKKTRSVMEDAMRWPSGTTTI